MPKLPRKRLVLVPGGLPTGPIKREDAIPALEPWMAVAEWLEGVSNAHLAVLLTEHQLLFTGVGTFASDLLSEVIDRLEGRQAPPGRFTGGDTA